MAESSVNLNEISKKDVLTRKEVAVYLGYTLGYVNKMCANRILPFYKPNGKNTYFNRAEIDAWCMRNKVRTIEEIRKQAVQV